MRTLLLALALAACDAPAPQPRDPNAPETYRVLRGDTWDTIASKRTTTPEDLRAWNGLPDDHVLVPGQILRIYRDGGPPEVPEAPAAPERAAAARVAEAPAADEARRAPVARAGVRLLSLLDSVADDVDLTAPTTRVAAAAPGRAGLGQRGTALADGPSEIGTVAIERPERPAPAGTSEVTAGAVPSLPKANARSCLPVRLEDPGEDGVVTAEGLGRDAIVAGMGPVVRAVGGCVAEGSGAWEVHLEVDVGCDGLVYDVGVVQDGGLPAAVTDCVAAVTRQASFAAAAGATSFLYPIHLRR